MFLGAQNIPNNEDMEMKEPDVSGKDEEMKKGIKENENEDLFSFQGIFAQCEDMLNENGKEGNGRKGDWMGG